MVKNKPPKRFAARVGALLCVLLICCCMVLPASAASGSEPVFYSVLPFDGVRLMESASSFVDLPWTPDVWLSRSTQEDSSANSGDAGYGVTNATVSSSTDTANFDVAFSRTLGSFNSVVFYADSAVISTSQLRDSNYYVYFGFEGEDDARISISFLANRMTLVGDDYQLQTKRFTETFHADSGTDVLSLISGMLTDGNYVPSSYVLLTDLEVVMEDFSNDDQWITFRIDLRQNRPSVQKWIDQYQLPYKTEVIINPSDPSEVSFVDWLVVAVSGFLDFELWPGMSLNEIMWVILVIGVMFWFFKLTI